MTRPKKISPPTIRVSNALITNLLQSVDEKFLSKIDANEPAKQQLRIAGTPINGINRTQHGILMYIGEKIAERYNANKEAIDERSVIFDYLPRDATIIVDEPKLLYDKLELIEKEHSSRVKSLVESGEVLPIHKESILTRAYALTYIRVMKRLAFQQLTALNPVFESNAVYTLKSQQPAKYYLDRNVLYTDVKNFNATGYKVMLCCGDENRAKNVSKSLKENDIYAECDEDFSRSKIIATKCHTQWCHCALGQRC